MKLYLRLLSYAGALRNFTIPFLLTAILATFFGVLNFTLLIPLLDVLFSEVDKTAVDTPTGFKLVSYFNYYVWKAVEGYGKIAALKMVCATIVLSVFLSNVFKYFNVRLLEGFKSRMVANLREAVFNKITHLHLGFFSNERKGNLISRVVTDVQEVENSIANTFSAAITASFLFIGYIFILFNFSASLTFFALLVIPISGSLLAFLVKKLKQDAGEGQKRLGNLISLMDETFGGMRVVKGFNAEPFISKKFQEENQRYKKAIFSWATRRELASPFSETMGVLIVAGILLYGGSLVLAKESSLSASAFVAYISIFSQIMRPAKEISNAFSAAQRGIASGERILNLIDSQSEIQDNPKAISLTTFEKEIKYQNVGFYYESGEKKILHDINFTLPKGKTFALVGTSGGGKSTIVDLFARFYDPSEGMLSIDGKGFKDVTQKSLRSLMGIVTQEAVLFNDTIYNNIAFGRNSSEAEIIQAAKIANAHEFILQQPNGYQTFIGDRGTRLSGGQRQRLSIARAILQNPPLLILDEATSALDTESEKLVQEALSNLMKNRTTLVIAHRLSTIQHADQILVIHEGKIAEQGSHEELITLESGIYQKLTSMQSL